MTTEQAQVELDVFVKAAMHNLAESKEHTLLPVALIKTGEELLVCGLTFTNVSQKLAMFRSVANLCRERDADGLVLVIDGHYKKIDSADPKKEEMLKQYQHGDLAKEHAPEAIIAVWIGPRVPHGLGVIQPYEKKEDGKVVWLDPVSMSAGSVETIFPAWWEA